jgi:methylmalonyl-CoA mutase
MSDTQKSSERLLAEFAPASYEEWRRLVEQELAGASFEQRLVGRTYEGIDLQPIYTERDTAALPHLDAPPGAPPYLRGADAARHTRRPWEICQPIGAAEPHAFNHIARHDLAAGASAIEILLDAASRAGLDPDHAPAAEVGQGGFVLITLDDLLVALDDVDLAHVALRVDTGPALLPAAALLIGLARTRGHVGALHGAIACDPLAELAQHGRLERGLAAAYDAVAALTTWAATNAPHLATVAVDAGVYHEAGADDAEELACAIAGAVDQMRALTQRGVPVATVAAHLEFRFALGAQIFMEIARLRAARLLWARVAASFGGDAAAQRTRIHTRTGRRNKSRLDPYVNMLRATVEAFAAIVGGCDSLTVGAFDEVIRPSDELARRVARNTQIMLERESHLGHVIDPGGGSWYIEALTDALARRAWARFQEIERAGGMAKALQHGGVQQRIATTAGERASALAAQRDLLVGTNIYTNPHEAPLPAPERDTRTAEQRAEAAQRARGAERPGLAGLLALAAERTGAERLDAAAGAAVAGATLGELAAALQPRHATPTRAPALAIRRDAEPFEAIER